MGCHLSPYGMSVHTEWRRACLQEVRRAGGRARGGTELGQDEAGLRRLCVIGLF